MISAQASPALALPADTSMLPLNGAAEGPGCLQINCSWLWLHGGLLLLMLLWANRDHPSMALLRNWKLSPCSRMD